MPNLKRATALKNYAFKPVEPKYSWQSKLFPPELDIGDAF